MSDTALTSLVPGGLSVVSGPGPGLTRYSADAAAGCLSKRSVGRVPGRGNSRLICPAWARGRGRRKDRLLPAGWTPTPRSTSPQPSIQSVGLLGTREFPARGRVCQSAGLGWGKSGDVALVGVEGTGSYGRVPPAAGRLSTALAGLDVVAGRALDRALVDVLPDVVKVIALAQRRDNRH